MIAKSATDGKQISAGDQRALVIYSHWLYGKTKSQIAKEIGVSAERARQLVGKGYRVAAKYGLATVCPYKIRAPEPLTEKQALVNSIVNCQFNYKPCGGTLEEEAAILGLDIAEFDEWLSKLKPCMVKEELTKRRARLSELCNVRNEDRRLIQGNVAHIHRMMLDLEFLSGIPKGTFPHKDIAWGDNY